MAKQMVFDDEARQPLLAGVSKLARAVRSTLGPRGRNAVLDKGWGSPKVTKDGVTVAEDIELDDPYENLGAQLVKEAASKTNDVAGDGTTTATVLAEAIFREGLKMIAAGADPMALVARHRQGGRCGRRSDHEDGRGRSTKRTRRKSSRSPRSPATTIRSIGKVLADAFMKVGKDGVITVEEGSGRETTVEVVEGMQFDRGFLSPHFVTNQDEVTVEFENCYILIYEEKISSNKKLIPLLEAISKANKPLLIIAEDIEGEALATLVVNKLRGILQVCAVKAPGYGDRRKAILGDIAVLPAATDLQGPRHRARKRQAVATSAVPRRSDHAEDTTIVGGAGKKEEIEGRAEQIRDEIDRTDSEYDREKLQERLAKLAGGVAQINCGAATETEMKERKWLVEDAQNATQAALEEGIVPGGGVALLRAEKALDKLELEGRREAGREDHSQRARLAAASDRRNAGLDGAVVVNRVRQLKGKNDGYDADKDEYGDLVKAGVIDPAKVVRTALAKRGQRRLAAAHHRSR